MNKKLFSLKKIFSVILIFILTITLAFPVSAAENSSNSKISNDTCTEIVKSLNYISNQKDNFGLSNVDFNSLSIGNQIHAYEYKNKQLSKLNFTVYPLISDEKLVAFAIKGDNKSTFEISTTFVNEIASDINLNTSFAFVYDKDTCYLYTQDDIKQLYKDNVINGSRDTFNDMDQDSSLFQSITLNNLMPVKSIDYTDNDILDETNSKAINALAAPNYVALGVSYVSQATNSNYCWASSVACIGNYLKSKSYTGEYVAKYVFGEANYDQTASVAVAISSLKNIYGVTYTSYNSVPSDNTILGSINSNLPLYSRWSSTYSNHATVISGINVIAGYITIMNPASGFQTAFSNGTTYTFISLNSGNTFTLFAYAK